MSDAMPRNSPLYRVLGQSGEVLKLAERAFSGHINLRGNAHDATFVTAVKSALGVEPPRLANTVAQAGELALFWLGPDEWQALVPQEQRAPLLEKLQAALAGQFAAVTDITDAQTIIVLDDARASELLSRGCPLDFHPSAFPVGTCAQTLIGKAGVLLLREAEQRYAILVRRSFAEYLYHLLQDAAALAVA